MFRKVLLSLAVGAMLTLCNSSSAEAGGCHRGRGYYRGGYPAYRSSFYSGYGYRGGAYSRGYYGSRAAYYGGYPGYYRPRSGVYFSIGF